MIIYNGDKYACISCIRGHRSSTCKHTARMLVKVRTRGRPSPVDIRDVIMVDITSQVKTKKLKTKTHSCDDDKTTTTSGEREEEYLHPPGHEDCCRKMDAQPIIFIKAQETKKAMVIDGKLKIIIKDPDTDGDDVNLDKVKYVSEKEFLSKISAKEIDSEKNDGSISKCCDPYHIVEERECRDKNGIGRDMTGFTSPPSTIDSITPEEESMRQMSPPPVDPLDSKKLPVDIFTHKGLYLSSECSCSADDCSCINCLIHRNDEELNRYILQSGVPLTNIIDSNNRPDPYEVGDCSASGCQCSLIDCTCQTCSMHPIEIIPFARFFYNGLNNMILRRKSIISFQKKLIPSEYWWDFLMVELPKFDNDLKETIDLIEYFNKIVEKYDDELMSSESEWGLLNDLEGFYVI